MEELILKYLPIAVVVIYICIQCKVFVTEGKLRDTKEEILKSVKEDYATKEIAENIKDDIREIKQELINLNEFIRNKA
jgi:hypothetical protein